MRGQVTEAVDSVKRCAGSPEHDTDKRQPSHEFDTAPSYRRRDDSGGAQMCAVQGMRRFSLRESQWALPYGQEVSP